jgi:large subunit ribosomal protein L13
VHVTGKKAQDKMYYRHTGYIGGLKEVNFEDLQARKPGRAIELAVNGMLPKGPLGRAMFKKMKVYAGAEHPHASQQPKVLSI